MNLPEWSCDGCGRLRTDDPAETQKHKGHRETVVIWFCADCVKVSR